MVYQVRFRPSAEKEFDRLPPDDRRLVALRINSLASDPRPPGSKKLRGDPEGSYRVRQGDYRIVYSIHDAVLVVLIVTIGHRREVYRGR